MLFQNQWIQEALAEAEMHAARQKVNVFTSKDWEYA